MKISTLEQSLFNRKPSFDLLSDQIDPKRKKERPSGEVFIDFVRGDGSGARLESLEFKPTEEQVKLLEKAIKDFYIAYKNDDLTRTDETYEEHLDKQDLVIRAYDNLGVSREVALKDFLKRFKEIAKAEGKEGERLFKAYEDKVLKAVKTYGYPTIVKTVEPQLTPEQDKLLQDSVQRFYQTLKRISKNPKTLESAFTELSQLYVTYQRVVLENPTLTDINKDSEKRLKELAKSDGEEGQKILRIFDKVNDISSSPSAIVDIVFLPSNPPISSAIKLTAKQDTNIQRAFDSYFKAVEKHINNSNEATLKTLESTRKNLVITYKNERVINYRIIFNDLGNRIDLLDKAKNIKLDLDKTANEFSTLQELLRKEFLN